MAYLLNQLQEQGLPYQPKVPRTREDDEAIVWNARLFQTTKRTHCSSERFDKIFDETMRYIMTTEHHMYMDLQSGNQKETDFVRWLRAYFARNCPEMSNANDYGIMYQRLRTAIFQYYVLQPLIDHEDTSDIKICAPNDIRVRVKGKAYRSSSNFINELDLFQFVEGLAIRNGLAFNYPLITFTDTHDENYILRFTVSTPMINAVDYPYMHIRKVSKIKPDFDRLIADNMLPPIVRDYLIDKAKTARGVLFSGPPGCVDGETEFFNGKEWKPICKWKNEPVLQFDTITNTASLVQPLRYIKEPCHQMYHITDFTGISQMLSPEHRVIVYPYDASEDIFGKPEVLSAEEFQTKLNDHTICGGIKTDFYYEGDGMDISDIELELELFALCYGAFSKLGRRCRVTVEAPQLKDRLLFLLNAYQKPYKNRELPDGKTQFEFFAPRKRKEFLSSWQQCSNQQLSLICASLRQWHLHAASLSGEEKTSQLRLSDTKLADFLQFACSASGYHARIEQLPDGSQLVVENQAIKHASHAKVMPVIPKDGYKYCFTVPTHALVLRRGGRIFITGNSGKTTGLNAFIEYIPKTRETLVIQENDELHTKQSGFMFKHVTHGYHAGEQEVSLEDLGKMALVEGCNEFVIGEIKGGEARYAMTLLNAGGYFAGTLHANGARETLDKLADLVKYGSDYSFDDARKMLKSMEVIVYMEQYQIQEILEVVDYDLDTHQYIYREIYKNPHPRWETENRPSAIQLGDTLLTAGGNIDTSRLQLSADGRRNNETQITETGMIDQPGRNDALARLRSAGIAIPSGLHPNG